MKLIYTQYNTAVEELCCVYLKFLKRIQIRKKVDKIILLGGVSYVHIKKKKYLIRKVGMRMKMRKEG